MKLVVKFKDGTKLTQFIDDTFYEGNFFELIRTNVRNNVTIETTDHILEEVVEMQWSHVYSLEIILL